MEEDRPLKDISPGDDYDPRRATYAANKAIGEQSALDERLRAETVESFQDTAQYIRTSDDPEDLVLNTLTGADYIGSVYSKDNIKQNKNPMRTFVKFELLFNKLATIIVIIFILIATAVYSYMYYSKG